MYITVYIEKCASQFFYGFNQRCRIFFFRGKVTTPLTHSFWRLAVFFFFPIRKKKNTDKKFRKFRNLEKNLKNHVISYNWFWVSKNYKFTPYFPIFRQKWWSRIYLAYFFFPEKVGSGKKKYRKFHSNCTHSLLFWDFLAKRNFSREKNTTPLIEPSVI